MILLLRIFSLMKLRSLRLWTVLGICLLGGRLPGQAPITVSAAVPASPFPQGEHVELRFAVTGCSPNCNPISIFIDGRYAAGTGLAPDGTISTSGLETVPVGDHTIRALYYDDPSATYTWSPATPFTVVTNTLPKPKVGLRLTPTVPIAGSWINLTMALSCGSGCGGGGGQLIVDGRYAGFNYLDGNGNASFWMPPDSPLLTAGLHNAFFVFFGNPVYSNVVSTPISFVVYPPYSQQPYSVSVAVPYSPFAAGEHTPVNIAVSCAPSCGTATVLVDGYYSYGTGIEPDGTIGTLSLAEMAPGDHTIQAIYVTPANESVAVSPPVNFTVVPNTLPVPGSTTTLNPASPTPGSSSLISIALSCGASCGGGGGQLFIDGWYAGFNYLDGNGVASFYTAFNDPFGAVGQHRVWFSFFGNGAYSNTNTTPYTFNISAGGAPVYDAGQVTLTVNGVPESVSYNQTRNATPAALASALASVVNADPNAAASASVSGSALSLTAKTPGAATNYAYSLSSTYDTADFAQPSFTAAPANGNLAGGADASTGSGAPQTVYGYSILKPDGTSGYAANGNLTDYTDSVTGTWSFGYDSLNRLTSGSTSTPIDSGYTSYCWNYDSFGNRLAQTGSNQPMADAAKCAAATGSNYTVAAAAYDASNHLTAFKGFSVPAPDSAGNITDDGNHQFLYDPEGRICAEQGATVAGITPMVQYLYDAEGRRVAKGSITAFSCDSTSNGFHLTSQYLLGPAGEQLTELDGNGAWVHTNVYAAGSMIATFDGKGAHFHLTDWLGTRRAQTDYKGTLEAAYTSLPFGDGLASTGALDPTEHHFTGKERDNESGLDYFGARYYASSMGRFMSPDSGIDQHPEDPQSWNLYTYGRNNPLVLVDPSGEYVCGSNVSSQQCDNVQKGLDEAQKGANALKDKHGADSSQYKDAQRAIDAYGKQNVDNGVTIMAGKAGSDSLTSVANTAGPATADNPNGQKITVTLGADKLNGAEGNGLDIGHEGSHVADGSAWVSSGFSPSMNPTRYGTEFRAFQVERNLAEGIGWSPLGFAHASGPVIIWRPGWTASQVNAGINQELRQHYNLSPSSKILAFKQNTQGGH